MEEPSGVEVYDKMFKQQKVKYPAYWKKVIDYF